ncbi:MAG TPA: ABC transporter permease [Thermoanaerobacterales bacterium]|nr:ABC transporter permease [Thermoanaerobacterales bacterium]
MSQKIKKFLDKFGYTRIIIILFLIMLFIAAFALELQTDSLISGILNRAGMNMILTLAMVPSIQSGTGLNFGLSVGILCGVLGAVLSIAMDLTGWQAFLIANGLGIVFAIIAGYIYGLLLNRVKTQEMLIGTYAGFSVVSGMCMFWILAPFKSPKMIWPYGGRGLRVTVSLEDTFDKILNNFLLREYNGIEVPWGLYAYIILLCLAVWLFSRSKTGIAMQTAGSNPRFAESCGINVDGMRIIGTILSTVLGAMGILVYAQSYGFLQLYNAPLYMAFPAVAAILIGGASVHKASIAHVIIGTFLFQALLVVALPVTNAVLPEGNLSEVVRIIISNGIIVYALTRIGGGE